MVVFLVGVGVSCCLIIVFVDRTQCMASKEVETLEEALEKLRDFRQHVNADSSYPDQSLAVQVLADDLESVIESLKKRQDGAHTDEWMNSVMEDLTDEGEERYINSP